MRLIIVILLVILGVQPIIAQHVIVNSKDRDSMSVILVQNNLPVPVTVHVISKIPSLDIKEWHPVPPESAEEELFAISKNKIPEGKDINEIIRIFFRIGQPGKHNHNDKYRYRYPFASGSSSRIVQGYHGTFSHQSIHSRYAIDFKMEIGDTIFAAREGLVAWVIEHNTEGGNDRSLTDKANEIIIAHNDGSFSVYDHLDHQGSLVEIGEQVERGQAIGICGLTGFTTTPHLHFVVRIINEKAESIAIPVLFEKKPGKRLKVGKSYRH